MQTPSISSPSSAAVDWADWLRRWDIQQTGYLADREERFDVMFDALDVLLPPDFVALDLCCGPGSLSQRLLARFPRARCIALDKDPLLLKMGQEALGDQNGRLRWIDADLLDPTWADAIADGEVSAVLSTTALHWLTPDQLYPVYRRLARLLKPGGLFLNGDNMKYAPHLPSFARLVETLKARRRADAFERRGVESWEQWWAALAQEPGAAALLAARERAFAGRTRDGINPGYDFQLAALQEAGFAEVGTLWQKVDNRVLLAVRSAPPIQRTPD